MTDRHALWRSFGGEAGFLGGLSANGRKGGHYGLRALPRHRLKRKGGKTGPGGQNITTKSKARGGPECQKKKVAQAMGGGQPQGALHKVERPVGEDNIKGQVPKTRWRG